MFSKMSVRDKLISLTTQDWYINDPVFSAKFGTGKWMGGFLKIFPNWANIGFKKLGRRGITEKKMLILVKIWPKCESIGMNAQDNFISKISVCTGPLLDSWWYIL